VLGLEDFLLAAEAVLGVDAERLTSVTKVSLAESALAAPHAGFGDRSLYEDPVQRAAVLASRIMRNHPLPDGNRRVALILMDLYLEQEGLRFAAAATDIDRAFRAVAAREMTEDDLCAWLQDRTVAVDGSPADAGATPPQGSPAATPPAGSPRAPRPPSGGSTA
jgi:death-on-curing protein